MKKEEKQVILSALKQKFEQYPNFYVTETQSITAGGFNTIRRSCFEKGVEVQMVKNTLLKRSLQELGGEEKYGQVFDNLAGVSVLFFSENPKEPANIISEFRSKTKSKKPLLKVVMIDGDAFVGDEQLAMLKKIKTQKELLGDVLTLIQSPMQSLLSGLQSPAQKLAGAIQTLETKS